VRTSQKTLVTDSVLLRVKGKGSCSAQNRRRNSFAQFESQTIARILPVL
jgi:hypothetical protein